MAERDQPRIRGALEDASTLRLFGEPCDRFETDASAVVTARSPCGAFSVD